MGAEGADERMASPCSQGKRENEDGCEQESYSSGKQSMTIEPDKNIVYSCGRKLKEEFGRYSSQSSELYLTEQRIVLGFDAAILRGGAFLLDRVEARACQGREAWGRN